MLHRTIVGGLAVLALLAGSFVAEADEWGTLKGRFIYDGKAPTPIKLDVSKEAACASHNLVDESLVVGDDGGLANVVVHVYLGRGKKISKIHPDEDAKIKEPVVLNNYHCRFDPHITLVRKNQTLTIKNSGISLLT